VLQLPPGIWYHYWTGERTSDRELIKLQPALDELPVYARAGSIVPRQPLVQSTSETPRGALELRVYPAAQDCKGSLYQDDGHSFDYRKGDFLRVNYSCQLATAGIKISSAVERDGYKPWWSAAEIVVFGLEKAPQSVRVGDAMLRDWHYDPLQHAAVFTIPEARGNWTAELIF